MQYHAKSLAQLHPFGFVTQIGYVGEEVMVRPNPQHKAVVMVEKRISPWEAPFLRRIALLHACTSNLFHSLYSFPSFPCSHIILFLLLFLSLLVVKGVGLLVQLFICLASLQRYDVVIIQNPPCLPALVAAVVMSLLNGSIIVIDWHNLGFAMFEERYGSRHILVRIAKILERFMTRRAHLHVSIVTHSHTITQSSRPYIIPMSHSVSLYTFLSPSLDFYIPLTSFFDTLLAFYGNQ